MPVAIRHLNDWRQIKNLWARDSGVWQRLRSLKVYHDGAWRLVGNFVQPLTVSITPDYANGFANPFKPTPQSITTNPVTAIPSGGSSPFTYVWSGGNSPTNASTTFTQIVPGNTDITTSYSVSVTDSLGSIASASVEAQFSNQSF